MSSTARDVVSRLIAREPATGNDANAAAISAGVLQRISSNLCGFIGIDGSHALLTRALSQAQAAHPALKNLSVTEEPRPSVHGVPESIQAHGAADTAAGLQSTLVALIELLGRLIGDELALKLVEQGPPEGGLPDGLRGRNDQ